MKIEDMFAQVAAFDETQGQLTDREMQLQLMQRRLELAEAVCTRLLAQKHTHGDGADTLSGLGAQDLDELLADWEREVARQECG